MRAERFVGSLDRARFEAAHVALRCVLARYASQSPAALVFSASPGAKPRLNGVAGLDFSLSYSGGWILIAVARQREVGVDVEELRELDELETAERAFSPKERRALRTLDRGRRRDAFFRGWTRKEAFIKATGEGLRRPLDSFDVSLGEEAALLATRPAAAEAAGWNLAEVTIDGRHLGAVAWKGAARVVPCDYAVDSTADLKTC